MEIDLSTKYQLYFYVPQSHLELVKQALFNAGAGKIGNYSNCSWQTLGQGQYVPTKNATPFLGVNNHLSKEEEYKVEMLCFEDCLDLAIETLKNTHPYEEPAYGIIKLEM